MNTKAWAKRGRRSGGCREPNRQRSFGSDSGIVGRMLTLNDERVELLGVLPEWFWSSGFDHLVPISGSGVDPVEIFRPLRYWPEQAPPGAKATGLSHPHQLVEGWEPYSCSAAGKVPDVTSLTYAVTAVASSDRRSAYLFTNRGTGSDVNPAMSCQTRI